MESKNIISLFIKCKCFAKFVWYCFRYYELDSDDSILYSLRSKSILEYPEILVVMSIHKEAFNGLLYIDKSPYNKPKSMKN